MTDLFLEEIYPEVSKIKIKYCYMLIIENIVKDENVIIRCEKKEERQSIEKR